MTIFVGHMFKFSTAKDSGKLEGFQPPPTPFKPFTHKDATDSKSMLVVLAAI